MKSEELNKNITAYMINYIEEIVTNAITEENSQSKKFIRSEIVTKIINELNREVSNED